MPRCKLVYTVVVDDADADSAREYLAKLQKTFRMISEELVAWGYSGDEITSFSDITEKEHHHA